jgi:hypothetical protein
MLSSLAQCRPSYVPLQLDMHAARCARLLANACEIMLSSIAGGKFLHIFWHKVLLFICYLMFAFEVVVTPHYLLKHVALYCFQ